MPHIFDIPNILATYGYIGIFIIVFLESGIFFPLPADSLLFAAGLLAGAFGLNIVLLMVLIFIATYFGSLAGYYIGTHIEKLQAKKFWNKILKPEYIEKTRVFFGEHGRNTILISRFVPIVRTFTPIVAGVIKMDYGLFKKYNLIGGFIWSTSVPLLGYFLGQAFPQTKDYLSLIVIAIVVLSTIPVILKMRSKINGSPR